MWQETLYFKRDSCSHRRAKVPMVKITSIELLSRHCRRGTMREFIRHSPTLASLVLENPIYVDPADVRTLPQLRLSYIKQTGDGPDKQATSHL